jgi:hypothetical protein
VVGQAEVSRGAVRFRRLERAVRQDVSLSFRESWGGVGVDGCVTVVGCLVDGGAGPAGSLVTSQTI